MIGNLAIHTQVIDRKFRTLSNWLMLLGLLFVLSGCGTSRSPTQSSAALGEAIAGDPMTVAETYLQQYQPGPLPRLFQTTRLFDRNGQLLDEYFDEGRRTWVGLNQVSSHLIDATIATEDASFYLNSGVEPGAHRRRGHQEFAGR